MNECCQKLFLLLLIVLLVSCSKKEPEINIPADQDKSFEIYKEAVEAMNRGDYFLRLKNFQKPSLLCLK